LSPDTYFVIVHSESGNETIHSQTHNMQPSYINHVLHVSISVTCKMCDEISVLMITIC